jgi:hypothetical protein
MTDTGRLCAAIDAGDDSALPALADALEEAGDPRADGLRHVLGYWPGYWPEPARDGRGGYTSNLSARHLETATRSAAFLALADYMVAGPWLRQG